MPEDMKFRHLRAMALASVLAYGLILGFVVASILHHA
jgi:hypothetical protein